MHMDGCHWYTFAYSCACGASLNTTDERSIADDPWSGVWYDESGECDRCRELRDGAEATHSLVVVSRDGTIEVQR